MLLLLWSQAGAFAYETAKIKFTPISAELACNATFYPEAKETLKRKKFLQKTLLKKMVDCKKNWHKFRKNTKLWDVNLVSAVSSMYGAASVQSIHSVVLLSLGADMDTVNLKNLSDEKYQEGFYALTNYYESLENFDRLIELVEYTKNQENIVQIQTAIIKNILHRSVIFKTLAGFPSSSSEYIKKIENSIGDPGFRESDMLLLLELYSVKDYVNKTQLELQKFLKTAQQVEKRMLTGTVSDRFSRKFGDAISRASILNDADGYWRIVERYYERELFGAPNKRPSNSVVWAYGLRGKRTDNNQVKIIAEKLFTKNNAGKRFFFSAAAAAANQYLYEKIIRCPKMKMETCVSALESLQKKFYTIQFVMDFAKDRMPLKPIDIFFHANGIGYKILREDVN